MNPRPLRISLRSARRLVVSKQRLAGRRPSGGGSEAILSVIRDLGYVQWDPVSIVAPSHLISLWSRLDRFRPQDLERLLWKDKKVFEHWTPMASLVLTEDYPLYASLMHRYPDSLTSSWGSQRTRAREFLRSHAELRRTILHQLKREARTLSDFRDHARARKVGEAWMPSSDVSAMLFHLTMTGEVMVVGHAGAQNLWGLSEGFLPGWVQRNPLPELEFEREAAQRAVRALGVATRPEITQYFVRGRYEHLQRTLDQLEAEGTVHRVTVDGLDDRMPRYLHDQDVRLLASLGNDAWHPRTSLVPPFDNLVVGTDRMVRMFGFRYVREQFLPREKRRFGTYVLPIVRGDQVIGRIDPRVERKSDRLLVQSVHAEHGAPAGDEVGNEIAETVARFAGFLGVQEVVYSTKVPTIWKRALR